MKKRLAGNGAFTMCKRTKIKHTYHCQWLFSHAYCDIVNAVSRTDPFDNRPCCHSLLTGDLRVHFAIDVMSASSRKKNK